mmetsp:Transcript_12408/g.34836  ORF Transcript_12408/g.34836 Transcript_12408/m.34836 type:complete len:145 (-) Transcript_12408:74-508(-)
MPPPPPAIIACIIWAIMSLPPAPPMPPIPLVTGRGPRLVSPEELLDALQPKLNTEEEIYLESSAQIFLALLGIRVDPRKGLDLNLSPQRVIQILTSLATQRDEELQKAFSQMVQQSRGRSLISEWGQDLAGSMRDLFLQRVTKL